MRPHSSVRLGSASKWGFPEWVNRHVHVLYRMLEWGSSRESTKRARASIHAINTLEGNALHSRVAL